MLVTLKGSGKPWRFQPAGIDRAEVYRLGVFAVI